MSTVIGLDFSLSAPGVCIRTDQAELFVWTIAPPKGVMGSERLDWYDHETERLVNQYAPKLVALEGYSFGSKSQQHKIGEGGGVVKLRLWRMGIPVLLVPPTNVKMFATGSGTASKVEVASQVTKRWGVEPKDDNQADACVLHQMGERHLGLTLNTLSYQEKAMSKCEYLPSRPQPATPAVGRPTVRSRTRPS